MPYGYRRYNRYGRRGRRRGYRRNYRRNYRRRYGGRKRNFYNTVSTKLNKLPTGIPDRTLMKFRYTTFLQLDGLPSQVYYFRGNSLFDPDFSGIGGQPTGLDQWANFYNKYKVYASKIQVTFLAAATTAPSGNCMVSVTPTTNDSYIPDYSVIPTIPYSRTRMLTPVSAGGNPVYIKNYIGTKKVTGDNSLDDLYESDIGNNPSSEWYWMIRGDTVDQTTNVSIDIQVTVTYYCELFDRVDLLAS